MQNPDSALQLTLSLGAYTAGMCLGGLIAITVEKYKSLSLESLHVSDADNKKAPLDILFFDVQPAGTFTDAAAPTISAADSKLITARASVAAADYVTNGGIGIATPGNVQKMVCGTGQSGTIWALVLLASGASSTTYTAAGNLTIRPTLVYVPGVTTLNR